MFPDEPWSGYERKLVAKARPSSVFARCRDLPPSMWSKRRRSRL